MGNIGSIARERTMTFYLWGLGGCEVDHHTHHSDSLEQFLLLTHTYIYMYMYMYMYRLAYMYMYMYI